MSNHNWARLTTRGLLCQLASLTESVKATLQTNNIIISEKRNTSKSSFAFKMRYVHVVR